jgi:hypothetical protein
MLLLRSSYFHMRSKVLAFRVLQTGGKITLHYKFTLQTSTEPTRKLALGAGRLCPAGRKQRSNDRNVVQVQTEREQMKQEICTQRGHAQGYGPAATAASWAAAAWRRWHSAAKAACCVERGLREEVREAARSAKGMQTKHVAHPDSASSCADRGVRPPTAPFSSASQCCQVAAA